MPGMFVLVLENGVLTEKEIAAGGGSSAVPTYVAPDEILVVSDKTQVLFTEEIDVDGLLDIDGFLTEVS